MAAQTRRSARLSATLLGRCGTPVLVPTRAGPGQHRSPVPALPAPGTWSSRLSRMSHRDLYRLSIVDPDQFWGSAAADRLRWSEPFHRVRDCDLSTGRIAWFLGGKINVSGEKRRDVGIRVSPCPLSEEENYQKKVLL